MSTSQIYFKYDGNSLSLKNHEIDAKVLADTLSNFADLIYEANTIVNGIDSSVSVKAKAGFVEGSFGVELIIDQGIAGGVKDLLPILGLAASAATGSLLSVLKNMKGKPAIDIEINESEDNVHINIGEEKVQASPEVAELATNPSIRSKIDQIIYKPLDIDGTSSFQLFTDPEGDLLVDISEDQRAIYKKPPISKPSYVSSSDTVATIEFINANKESGNSGWKMIHLGKEVSVKIEDEVFLTLIKKPDAPSIFGHKFKVDLNLVTKKRISRPESKKYTIKKVRSKV